MVVEPVPDGTTMPQFDAVKNTGSPSDGIGTDDDDVDIHKQ
jgi:hypothetical protein